MIRKLALIGALGAGMLALGGCDPQPAPGAGGGGGGGGTLSGTLTGTAATGAVLVSASVEIMGANGSIASGTTNNAGVYNISVNGLTAPVIVTVVGGFADSDGAGPNAPSTTMNTTDLFSVSYTGTGTAHVTTLTTLALQNAAGQADLLNTIYNNWGTAASRPTLADIQEEAARVRANLAAAAATVPTLTNWSTYDFFTASFPTIGTSVDGLMDLVTCTASSTGTYSVSCLNGSTPFAFNLNISTSGFTIGSGGGGGGGSSCTSNCQIRATYTVTFNLPVIGPQTTTVTETTTGSVPDIDLAAFQSSILNEYSGATGTSFTTVLNTPTHKTFRATFNFTESGLSLAYTVTYDYVQL